jgi:hypothetical protein
MTALQGIVIGLTIGVCVIVIAIGRAQQGGDR